MAGSPYRFGILLIMALKNTQVLVGMATLTTFVDFSPPGLFVVSGSLLMLPPAAVVPLTRQPSWVLGADSRVFIPFVC